MANNDLKHIITAMAERYQLSPRFCLFMEQHLLRYVVPESMFLLRENQVQDRVYVLHHGIALGYYLDEDITHIGAWVNLGPQVIGNVSEFIYGEHTTESIYLIKGSILYYLKRGDLHLLNGDFPELPSVYYKILKEQQAHYRIRRYCRDTRFHPDRIQRFEEHYPNIILQLPHRFMASYLGMARETYTRLLRKLPK